MLMVVAFAASATLVGCQAGHPAATTPATTSAQGNFDCPYLSGTPTNVNLHLCYSPQQFRIAYGIQPLVARGVDGRGQTVVLPELYPNTGTAATSDVRQDLAFFDQRFGLPDVRLQIITRLAGGALPYQGSNEEAGDVEMVHAIAPDATIRVVYLDTTWGNDYVFAIAFSRDGRYLAAGATGSTPERGTNEYRGLALGAVRLWEVGTGR